MICTHIICCQVLFTHRRHRAIFATMPKKTDQEKGGSWIFRDIPRELMKRAKIAAAVEGKSIKALILEALDEHLQGMEKKGLLPKGKG